MEPINNANSPAVNISGEYAPLFDMKHDHPLFSKQRCPMKKKYAKIVDETMNASRIIGKKIAHNFEMGVLRTNFISRYLNMNPKKTIAKTRPTQGFLLLGK